MKTITLTDAGVAVERFSTIGIQNGSWHFYAQAGDFTINCYKGNIDDVDKAFMFQTIVLAEEDAYVLDLFGLITKFVWFEITGDRGDTLLIEPYGEV